MTEEKKICEECGYEDNSFACKIRHININTENLKRTREDPKGFGLTEQR